MLNKFEETKRKQRFGLRKLKVGVASVLLGFTIFGFNLASQQVTSVHADVVATDTGSDSSSETNDGGASSEVTEASTAATDGKGVSDGQPSTSDTTNTPGGKTRLTEKTSSDTADNDAAGDLSAASEITPTDASTQDSTPNTLSKDQYWLEDQPMLIDLRAEQGENSWVYKNLKHHEAETYNFIKDLIARRDDLYFFGAYVDYNESYHIITLLALDRKTALAGYDTHDIEYFIIHTGLKDKLAEHMENGILTPAEGQNIYTSTYERTDYPIQVVNYQGETAVIRLSGMDSQPGQYGLVPAFDNGQNTGLMGIVSNSDGKDYFETTDYDTYSKTHSNAEWQIPIPQMITQTVRYVDQYTGQEIRTPDSFVGFTYEPYHLTMTAPAIDGYKLVNSPSQVGVISPYQVGQTYNLYYEDNVVVKQKVLNARGDVQVQAFYNGLPIPGTRKVLTHDAGNDSMEFVYNGVWHPYKNKITATQSNLTYYYQSDAHQDESQLRIHFVDVSKLTQTSGYVPEDGTELYSTSLEGALGTSYATQLNLPAQYNDYKVVQYDPLAAGGRFSNDIHDLYVYLDLKNDADKNDPTSQSITIVTGHEPDETDAKNAIVGAELLPENTQFSWKKLPDFLKAGTSTGTVEITYPDHSTDVVENVSVTVTGKDFPNLPAEKIAVKDVNHLTSDEKKLVAEAINKANTMVKWWIVTADQVSDNGDVTMKHSGVGSQVYYETLLGKWLVKQETLADTTSLNEIAKLIPVKDVNNLSRNEKATVTQAIKTANPTLPADTIITVNNDGSATVTFSDKSNLTIPADKLIKLADSNTVKYPTKVMVSDPEALTGAEVARIQAAVRDVNQTAIAWVTDSTGNTKVSYSDGSSALLLADDLVVAAAQYPEVTPVDNPKQLSPEEINTVKAAIEAANQDYFAGKNVTVTVHTDGSATITYEGDDNQYVLLADKLVREKSIADKTTPNVPKDPQVVAHVDSVTDDEKHNIIQAIETANQDETGQSTLPAHQIEVEADGTAKITYTDDNSVDTIPGDQLVVAQTIAGKTKLNKPTEKVKVDDDQALSSAEITAVKQAVEAANMRDGKSMLPAHEIDVAANGTATITYTEDQSKDTIDGKDLVVKKQLADKTELSAGDAVKVNDKSSLNPDEINSVKTAIDKANSSAPIKSIEVDQTGKAKVTFTDGSVKEIQGNVVEKTVAEKTTLSAGEVVKVDDPKNLTADEQAAVAEAIKKANPDAPIKDVKVGSDGKATVTFNDNSEAPIDGNIVAKKDAEKTKLNAGEVVKVDDPKNLTADEQAAVAEAIKKANPDAPIKDVKVGSDGKATVTFNDNSEAPIDGNIVAKKDAEKTKLNAGEVVKVDDPKNLTADEQAAVAEAIKKANPDAPIKDVKVGSDGKATVTFNDNSEAPIDGNIVAKKDAEKTKLNAGEVVKVDDPKNLTADEQAAVAEAIKKANPDAPIKDVKVGSDGKATVTFNDNSEAPIDGNIVAKKDAEKTKLNAGEVVKVDDPKNLTADEQAAVAEAIKKANPDAPIKDVKVGSDGKATVTFNDNSEAPIDGNIVAKKDAEKTKLNAGEVVKVDDPKNLTADEQAAVAEAIKKANPDAPIKDVKVGSDGKATVTFNDNSEAPIDGNIVAKKDAEKTKLNAGEVVKVDDPKNLTADEQAAVAEAIKKANPDAPIKDVKVGSDGKATVTFNDNSEAPIDGNIVAKKDAEKTKLNAGEVVKVDDPKNLTADEQAAVAEAIKKANPDAPIKDVKVGSDGKATVTFNDNSEAPIDGNIVAKKDAEKTKLNAGEVVKVDDPKNLTADEQAAVAEAIKKANPDAPIKDVKVGSDGKATVTFNDNSEAPIDGNIVAKKDAEKTKLNAGEVVKVDDPKNLTADEQAAVAEAIKKANPDAPIKDVKVGSDGKATVTFNDNSEAPIDGNIVAKKDAEKTKLNAGEVVKVDDPKNLTADEQAAVAEAIKKANPDAPIKDVKVGSDGKATVTFNDNSEAPIDGNIVAKKDAEKTKLNAGEVVKVDDPKNLTADEQAAVAEAIKKANPDAPIKDVKVGSDGKATVTFNDNSEAPIDGNIVAKKDAEKTKLNAGEVVKVDDPKNLTADEQAAVAEAIKKANPDAPIKDVKVGSDGKATVTFNDNSEAPIDGNIVAKKDAEKTKLNAGEVVKVDDPKNLTADEQAAVAEAIKKANPDAPIKDVKVGSDGKATVTFNDNSEAPIDGNIVAKKDAEKTKLNAGEVVKVDDPKNLTADEQAAVAEAIKKANPDAPIKDVKVGSDGKATVTFNDNSEAPIDGNIVAKKDAEKTKLNAGEVVKVDDPKNLTADEQAAVAEAIKKANPDAPIKDVKVGSDGKATVTFNDNSEAPIDGNIVAKKDAEKTKLNAGEVVKVDDPKNLTADEQAAVAEAIKKANPDAPIKDVKVGSDGKATVTFNDNSEAPIDGNIVAKKDAEKTKLNAGEVVKVDDPKNLTADEQAAVAEAIKKANPDAPIKGVKVGSDGKATVTFNDNSEAPIDGNIVAKKDAEKTKLNAGEVVKVDDPKNLTADEQAAVAEAIKKANPDAPIKDVKVGSDGKATVTFNDNSEAPIDGNIVAKKDAEKTKLNAGEVVKVDDPKNLTADEQAAVAEAIKKANPDAPIKDVKVGSDGKATVTFNDNSEAPIDGNIVAKKDAEKTKLNAGEVVKVDDPKNLTADEQAAVAEAIKKANPDAPIKDVKVGSDGKATVTFNDNSEAPIDGNIVAKKDAEKTKLNAGEVVKVDDPKNLTADEQAAVAEAIKKANPDAPIKDVKVGSDGKATVTFNDNSEAPIDGNIVAKKDAEKTKLNAGEVVKVDDPKNLTADEQAAVAEAIKKANPDAPIKDVKVGSDGKATVTFNDNSEAPIDGNIVAKKDAEKTKLNAGEVVKVDDPKNLTADEQAAVAEAIKKANPDAPIKDVKVGSDGKATVTFNDNSEAPIDGNIVAKKDAEKTKLNAGEVVKVDDPKNLTADEQAAVAEAIKKANPDAPIKDVKVGSDGKATVTFNDNSEAPIDGNIVAKKDAEKTKLNAGEVVKVDDPKNLTADEQAAVAEAIKKANPDAPIKGVKVGSDGKATVTFNDNSEAPIDGNIVAKKDAEKTKLNAGEVVKVDDPKNLTADEQAAVAEAIKKANPDAPIKDVKVGSDGKATVTFNDNSEAPIDGNIVAKKDAEKTKLNAGEVVKVDDPKNLTADEQAAVAEAIKKANPDAPIKDVKVGSDGKATVTFNDNSEAPIDGNIVAKKDAEKTKLNAGEVVKVDDPKNLTADEQAAVAEAIKKANPDAPIKDVKVGSDGKATVTFNDNSEAPIDGNIVAKKDAEKTKLNAGEVVKVDDPKNLTADEQAAVAEAIKKANPDAPIKDVKVGSDGKATVTFNDNSEAPIDGNIVAKKDAEKTKLNAGEVVKVDDPKNLTADEQAAVAEAIKKANPDAPIKDVKVGSDGKATVTFNDNSEAPIDGNIVAKKDAEKTKLNAGEVVKVDDPKNLTADEQAAVAEAIKKANPDAPIKDVKVGSDGKATVTFNDNSEAPIDGNIVAKKDAEKTKLNAGEVVKVDDPKNLTADEQAAVAEAIKKANPDAPIKDVKVGSDGKATVTFNDNSEAPIDGNIVAKKDAEKTKLNAGEVVKVDDPKNLTADEQAAVAEAIKKANPDAPIKDVKVGSDGKATVTFNDNSEAPIDGNIVAKKDAEKTKLNAGEVVKVDDPKNLTADEQAAVAEAIKKANPDAPIKDVKVGSDGKATVTFNDNSEAPIDGNIVAKKDAEKTKLNAGEVVKVDDPKNLTADEQAAVAEAIKKANPDAPIKDVKVGSDGKATVTFNDNSEAPIDGNIVAKKDAEKTKLNAGEVVKVDDPKNLTADEQAAVAEAIKKANPDAPIKDVKVGSDGKATVTFNDNSEAPIDGNIVAKSSPKISDQVTPKMPETKVKVTDPNQLTPTEQTAVENAVKEANKDQFPTGTQVDTGVDGTTTITYPDQSTDTLTGKGLVTGKDNSGTTTEKFADQVTPKTPETKVEVTDPNQLTPAEQTTVENAVKEANKDQFPAGTQVETGADGTTTITYPDNSTDTLMGKDLVTGKGNGSATTEKVTADLEIEAQSKIYDGQPSPFEVTLIDENGNHLTLHPSEGDLAFYQIKDGTKVPTDLMLKFMRLAVMPSAEPALVLLDEVPVDPGHYEIRLSESGKQGLLAKYGNQYWIENLDVQTDFYIVSVKDAVEPKVPTEKVLVNDPTNMSDGEKSQVKDNVVKANQDDQGNSTLPKDAEIKVGNDGTVTITYADGSEDTINGSQLVEQNEAGKTNPTIPDKTKVDDPTNLSDGEKDQVKDNVEKANPETTVDVDDKGNATITYSDGSKDQIPGKDLVDQKTDAEKTDPKVPNDKVKVDDDQHLTDGEKDQVKDNVEKANPGTTVTVDDHGTAKITYPDKSTDTIPGKDLVAGKTDAEKTQLTVPGDKTKVDDPSNLSDGEKAQVKDNVEKSNPGTTVTVDNDGTATIKYSDQSTDTIPGKDLVTGKTDAEKTQPTVPGDKTKVDDPSNLSDGEKDQVKDKVEKSNPGTTVTVDDDGTAKITYPDKSTDTIPGKDLVTGKTDAEKTQPTVPGDKTKVDDPTNLSDGEKDQVKDKVEKSNPGTTVTVDDQGNTTIQYPDGSKNEIPGNQLIDEKSDAEKTTPNVPAQPVKVDDPTNLTAGEKAQVKDNVGKANPETTVTVENDGTATITYPDGSKATISGDQLVKGKTDAEKATPNLPTTKTPVQDLSHLTPAEQAAVQANVAKANAGAVVTVDAQGNAILTYPDGSQLTLKADQLVKAAVNATVAPSPSAATPAPTPAATPVQAAALPQTGDANATALALSGLTLALIGLIGAKKKRSEEN